MYVCICNGLNEESVKEAVNNGSKSCKDIWNYHECEGKCRKCADEFHQILKENKDG